MFGKMSEVLKLVIEKMEKRSTSLVADEASEVEKVYRKPKWGFYYV